MEPEESGKTLLARAQKVKKQIKEGNVKAAKASCAKTEKGAEKHKKAIAIHIKWYKAVEEHYKQRERDLTESINNVHAEEQSIEKLKSAAETQLSCERNELSQHRSDLSAAENHLSHLMRKKKRARRRKRKGFLVAGVVGGLATFGVATPVTASLAACAAATACASGQAEKNATGGIGIYRGKIESSEQKVRQSQNKISSFSSKLSQLSIEKSSLITERCQLQEEKGKIKETIAFLLDAQRYWSQFHHTTEDCKSRTALTGKILAKAEARSYSLFDSKGTKRVLATFEEAWHAFEEMNENGTNYIFEMDFQCTRCSTSYREFPHVNNSQLICSSCHDALEL